VFFVVLLVAFAVALLAYTDDPPTSEPPPPPPPPPNIITVNVREEVAFVGGAVQGAGDDDIHSSRGELTRADGFTLLYVDSNSVYLAAKVDFTETTGDRTQIRIDRDHLLYVAPEGKKIDSIEPLGGPEFRLAESVVGENHACNPAATSGSYWESLEIRFDGRGGDSMIVGIRGRIRLAVDLVESR